jgi:Zn-dependent metalloprotease
METDMTKLIQPNTGLITPKFPRTAGIVPPYILEHLIKRFPDQVIWRDANDNTRKIVQRARVVRVPNVPGAGKAEILVYDAKNTEDTPGTKYRFEGEPAGNDVDLNNIFDISVQVRAFHKYCLSLNGMDNAGMDYENTGHYGVKYPNAFNDGTGMRFGDGDGKLFKTFIIIDIVAHEDGHEITLKTCALEYQGQPGALNEHLSDVDGVVCRQFTNKLSSEQDSWLIGPGCLMPSVKGVALRSMKAPGTAYDDPDLGKDPQPDRMSKFVQMDGDNGGVHYNSGIPNKAFCVWSLSVKGNAWETTYPIWWELRHKIKSDCDFATFAATSLEICSRLLPAHLQDLKDAWATVEVKPAS